MKYKSIRNGLLAVFAIGVAVVMGIVAAPGAIASFAEGRVPPPPRSEVDPELLRAYSLASEFRRPEIVQIAKAWRENRNAGALPGADFGLTSRRVALARTDHPYWLVCAQFPDAGVWSPYGYVAVQGKQFYASSVVLIDGRSKETSESTRRCFGMTFDVEVSKSDWAKAELTIMHFENVTQNQSGGVETRDVTGPWTLKQ